MSSFIARFIRYDRYISVILYTDRHSIHQKVTGDYCQNISVREPQSLWVCVTH